jgi:hypothetical protein
MVIASGCKVAIKSGCAVAAEWFREVVDRLSSGCYVLTESDRRVVVERVSSDCQEVIEWLPSS